MYLEYFGLAEKPFSVIPDADFIYMSPGHQHALTMLEYGVFEQSGITLITGGVGCGKTTLLRHLLRTLPYDSYTVGMVANIHPSLGSLLNWVALALELDWDQDSGKFGLFRELQNFLIEEHASGKEVLLILDEAQNMDLSDIEELRMLLNINADKLQLLKVVLIGQPELKDLLAKPDMEQVTQRITSEAHLEPLLLNETKDYIKYRLTNAGGNAGIFSPEAIIHIHKASEGIPRVINILCDKGLVAAYGADSQAVTGDIMTEVIRGSRRAKSA